MRAHAERDGPGERPRSTSARGHLYRGDIAGGVALTQVAVNTPMNVLAAAQQAPHTRINSAVLAAISAEPLLGVAAFTATFPGLLTIFGPYLGSLGTGAGGVVSSAANTVIAALSGLPPSPTTAAPTAAAGTLTAPTPAESAIASTSTPVRRDAGRVNRRLAFWPRPNKSPHIRINCQRCWPRFPPKGSDGPRHRHCRSRRDQLTWPLSWVTGHRRGRGCIDGGQHRINTAPALLPARTVSLAAAPSTGRTNATVSRSAQTSAQQSSARSAQYRHAPSLSSTRPLKGTRQVVRSSADDGAAANIATR